MDNFKLNISKEYQIPGNGTIEAFVHSDTQEMNKVVQNLPCMIVCPGGGYHFVSEREAEPIGIDFYNRGYNAIVLTYDVAPDCVYPLALTQLACTVDYVRKNHDKLRINPDKIYVCGFSAGGHLVGCLANFWSALPCDFIDAKKLDAKPNAVILSYPVIYPESHLNSFINLTGSDDPNSTINKKLSLDLTANEKNPPCFVWTTAEDNCVRPDATLRYATAMYNNHVKFECHIFPTGWHGGSTCDARTNENFGALACADVWMDLSAKFLQNL